MSEQHFTTTGPVRLEVGVAAGEIDIATVDGAEATVTVTGSQRLVDATTVELTGDRLRIHHQRKLFAGFLGFDGPFRVQVQVPHRSRVEIVTASGTTTVDGAIARLVAKTASGDIRVTGELDGDATVKTVSGDVQLPQVSGDVDVRTVSGDVGAASVAGSLSVKSVSGCVRVASLREGTADVQSVSGDVELGVAAGTNVEVDAGSASGQVSSEVPLSGAPSGEPGPRLVVRSKTVSGDFRLVRA